MWIEEINQDTKDWLDDMSDNQFISWLELGREIVNEDQFKECLDITLRELEEIQDYEKCQLLVKYKTSLGMN